ncbi:MULTISPECIES: hypothetical protein [Streptomyces]|uniref:hypothetical protein n=1 Tax=Streptomyces TaxID=1883 RepID=UPI001E2D0756|nr:MULTISPECIES: hypothetical protein [Streptomyces]UFQ16455.1 hypothetical protein J2N69_16380 [Streptomyces huasconensis]WCL86057.1 hypothetical protein PPN52_16390 [Streptomyces sp. JCM 35825]
MTLNQLGDVVRDINRCQTGEVIAVNGDVLTVARPSGYEWEAKDHHCRPADPYEMQTFQTSRELCAKGLGSAHEGSVSS